MNDHLNTALKIITGKHKLTDVRAGGIVFGDSHIEGGIPIWVKDEEAGDYILSGEMEGLEFIMNEVATEVHRKRLAEINSYSGDEVDLIISEETNCLYYNIESGDAVLAGKQFIVNRRATSAYLAELCKLNETTEYPQQLI